MIEQEEEEGVRDIKTAVVAQFPRVFRGNCKANKQKAADWWAKRTTILDYKSNSITRLDEGVVKRVLLKASGGRMRKRSEWVI
ncbi:hypothetical protein PybrP1_010759 [[Pythium] brassicae (nom. inval.)]|nr:hypothetical protein PybrP1_010759 [[Pythium] brassicae (nom. inval.)]